MTTPQRNQPANSLPNTAAVTVTPSPNKKITVHDPNTNRKGKNINDLTTQEAAIETCLDFMGSDFWVHNVGSGRRHISRVELLLVVRKKSHFDYLTEEHSL